MMDGNGGGGDDDDDDDIEVLSPVKQVGVVSETQLSGD